MSTTVVRLIFAALCGVFFFTIGGVALWEWLRFRRKESALSPRHLRFRLLSALTWLVVLGTFFVSTLFLWPQSKAEVVLARRFVMVSSSGLALMIVAFVLMSIDIFWTVQVGRLNALKRSRQTQEALQRELERRKSGGTNGTS